MAPTRRIAPMLDVFEDHTADLNAQYSSYYDPEPPKLPPRALFNTSHSTKHQESDHGYPPPPASAFNDFSSEPSYDLARYALGKHPISEAVSKNNAKRRRVHDEELTIIPEPEDMPPVQDEPDAAKPPFSYSQLIGMAILRAPNRRLTLASIYKWISDNFKFYDLKDSGWTNSIRHNLSLSKSFYKQERPKDDPGKGNYWAITESDMKNFVGRDKKLIKPIIDNPSYFSHSDGPGRSFDAFTIPPKPARAVDSSTFPPAIEISSDATLPESEPTIEEKQEPVPLPDFPLASSPISANMNSSPPVARHTPPPPPVFASHTRSGKHGHRRKRTVDDTFKDSGFFSSINSSVPRPIAAAAFINPETGRRNEHRSVKRGRAEEEIARIRGSSFDPSPSKPTKIKLKPAQTIASDFGSSPLRAELSSGVPPLTPGIKLMPPSRPPPTISPNTHLRRHREAVRDLIGTPANNLNALAGWTPGSTTRKSPAFLLSDKRDATPEVADEADIGADEEQLDLHDLSAFQSKRGSIGADPKVTCLDDIDFDSLLPPDFSAFYTPCVSPLKSRSNAMSATSARPAWTLQRAVTASGPLIDITKRGGNVRLASPISFEKGKHDAVDPSFYGSPVKKSKHLPSLGGDDAFWLDDVWASSEDGKENMNHEKIGLDGDGEEESGIDLTQGFGRIGGGETTKMPQPRASTANTGRPALGRSMTNFY